MGQYAHRCIIVTSETMEEAEEARTKAIGIFAEDMVTEILGSPYNFFYTFFVGPDGGKLGKRFNDSYDDWREMFCKWLREKSPTYEWSYVQYYDDFNRNYIIKDGESVSEDE